MTSPLAPEPNSPHRGSGERALDLFDHAPVGLWEANTAGVIVAINHTLLHWVGRERADVIGHLTIEALISPGGVPALQAAEERCRRAGQVEGAVLLWRAADGHQFPGEVTATAIYDAQGAFCGWRGCVRDVTREQLRSQQQSQERALEAIERLASGVAHKFNNLLQVIQGYAELGLITLESANPVHGYLARIKDAAQRAASLVQGLVAFSRRQAGRRRSLEMDAFLAQLSGRLRRALPAGVELRLSLGATGARVLADVSSLEQVVWHVVVNAWEAMPQGGTVALETRFVRGNGDDGEAAPLSGPSVCLSVRDTGMGIEPGVLGQIFEPFFTTKATGSGLGLAVVWGVVKQHGGHVEVASQRHEGTTVRIYLPVENFQEPATNHLS
jgi:two-component system cell cycle sensor histidine kinase/response regulator CckA